MSGSSAQIYRAAEPAGLQALRCRLCRRSGRRRECCRTPERRLDKSSTKTIAVHRTEDEPGSIDLDAQCQCRIQELQCEAQATLDFIARALRRHNAKGHELKTNSTLDFVSPVQFEQGLMG